MKLIFRATRVNLRLHCSLSSRRRRATDEELVTLDKGLMMEALQGGQQELEQVNSITPPSQPINQSVRPQSPCFAPPLEMLAALLTSVLYPFCLSALKLRGHLTFM